MTLCVINSGKEILTKKFTLHFLSKRVQCRTPTSNMENIFGRVGQEKKIEKEENFR
jgi:hypothetical protein